jgi:hypothetical protein
LFLNELLPTGVFGTHTQGAWISFYGYLSLISAAIVQSCCNLPAVAVLAVIDVALNTSIGESKSISAQSSQFHGLVMWFSDVRAL